MIKLSYGFSVLKPLNMGLLSVDMDTDAEIYVIYDRKTLQQVNAGIRPPTGILKLLLPYAYSLDANLIVGLIDNDRTYAAKFVDGVMLEAVNSITVDMSQ